MTFMPKFPCHDLFPTVSYTPRRKEFKYFTILLNEDKTNLEGLHNDCPCFFGSATNPEKEKPSEDMILKLGKLLKEKIQAHSGENVELFTGNEVIANNTPSLVSVMFRLATEDFVRKSSGIFKIIECRNSTKLSTEWKPSLVDIVISLGHQVILVELTEFPHYTDFAYSILRQINYEWKIRLPRSFFYPDDVCQIDYSNDQQVVVVTPLMPDGDIDLASRIQDNLKYEILRMIKDSCANGLKNHLLKRDFRVGRFSDTEIGVNSIRHIYRTLQRRLQQQGSNIQMGKNSQDFHQFLLSVAGDSLLSAESYIEYCKNPSPDTPPGIQTSARSREETLATGDTQPDSETEPDILDQILKALKDLDLKSSDGLSNSLPYSQENSGCSDDRDPPPGWGDADSWAGNSNQMLL
ncbi:unnamed protein product [Allacma fusca]|uniref:Uncharacterized protein n=1 Tax=Allacma fusca TaxID=39272 RepID=A0A8J2L401_9HEXA|nr:unnamed protein product [Allacma fusca]